MSCLKSRKEIYENSIAQRFLLEKYGNDSCSVVLVERPDHEPSCGGRQPRNEGWPDFIYCVGKDQPYLVVELGRWNEGKQEIRFEKSVEQFGKQVEEKLRG